MSAIESWFAPATVAEPRRRAAAKAKPKPKPKAKRRQRRNVRVRASVVWMALFALLLVGVVAVNVAVLRANVSSNDLDKQIAERQRAIATLKSEYARDTAAPRVAAAARKARLVLASCSGTCYLDMLRGK